MEHNSKTEKKLNQDFYNLKKYNEHNCYFINLLVQEINSR